KIGIPSNHLVHPNPRFGTNFVDYVQINYVEGIRQAGGVPIILPMGDPNDAETYLDSVDGLLLTGGQDVPPQLYGDEPIRELGETDIYRDQFEIALIKAAQAAHKPVLGICRGQQIINVALGGTLYQDIYVQQGTKLQHGQYPTAGEIPTHSVTATDGSWLQQNFGKRFLTNSFHHQAVNKLGQGLKNTGVADDGISEAIESGDGLLFAVQFHPEMMFKVHPEFVKIFQWVVDRT
ncbi:gamma-glutamyl-gamma-aminobutyrate hydrolase family protein, partial [Secundilactobacillus folii]